MKKHTVKRARKLTALFLVAILRDQERTGGNEHPRKDGISHAS
jgi:hypothetical protein